MIYQSYHTKSLIVKSLTMILANYASIRELYQAIKDQQWQDEKEEFSYSQFNRYIKGTIAIRDDKEDLLIRFLMNNFNLSSDLIKPNIDLDIKTTPIHIELRRLISYPEKLEILAFHVINQDHLRGKYDVILTHSEAIPIAVAFSQYLQIPWVSISFRQPSTPPSKLTQIPYFIEKELVGTAYFGKTPLLSKNKSILVISDYIRRGGFIDILFRVAEDNEANVKFLFSLIGIGKAWKHFESELEGNVRVIHFI